jgi:glutamate-ammonia-ligase adenylyltransferase
MISATDSEVSRELAALPPVLQDYATRVLQDLGSIEAAREIPADRLRPLLRMLACSEFAASVLQREANWFAQQGKQLDELPSRPDLQQFAQAIAVSADSLESVQGEIRRYRNRYYLQLLWREYSGLATLNETLRATSELADALLLAAAGYAQNQMRERFGEVQNERGEAVGLVVLGMGKLGGSELNLSSDVDLIFLYPGGNDSNGRKSLSPQEYFTRVGRTMVTLLEAPTADGFAFRVDTRLRPFGDSGPPVSSFAALEAYLLQHGRGWERYAYVKARAVGPVPPAEVLADLYDNMISPFVYRRYLDYGVFESLRDMHALITADVQRRELADNIKLGPGGIREIEFIVQSLQLVRGGGEKELQGRELQEILPLLAGRHDLTAIEVDELLAAYRFLRRVENFIQAIRDQQTHELPGSEIDRARLALAMGCADWTELAAGLKRHRAVVAQHFDKVAFRERAIPVDEDLTSTVRELWKNASTRDLWAESLQREGFAEAEGLADGICQFRTNAAYADASANRRLAEFVPKLFALLADLESPAVALHRVLSVAEKVLRRSAYIALLNENDAAMAKLVDLCSRSSYVTRQVAQYPLLLDELLDPGDHLDKLSRAEMATDLAGRATAVSDADSEAQMEVLARFQRITQFRIAMADYDEALPIMRVSDCLTELAETVLEFALNMAWRDLSEKHGAPGTAGFAIIAYGKFGGLEFSYGSDLDLVFLHDSNDPGALTDGAKPLDHTMFFTRLVRRLMHYLTTRTA